MRIDAMNRMVRLAMIPLFLSFTPSLLTVTGCKRSAQEAAAREERLKQEIENAFAQIQKLQAEGQFAEALALTEKGLANKAYASQKARFFDEKLDLLFAQGNCAAAEDLAFATWKTDPALGCSAFNRLQKYYLQTNKHREIKRLCDHLLDASTRLPADLRLQVFNWQLAASFALKDLAGVQSDTDNIIAQLKPEDGVSLLQRVLEQLLDSGQKDVAAALIGHIAQKNLAEPLYKNMIVTFAMRYVLAASAWDKAPAAFHSCVTQLPDDQLLKLMRTAFSAFQKSNRKDLTEQTSRDAAFNGGTKTNAVNFAARIWVDSGVTTDKKLLPERLEALLKANISPIQVGNLYDRYFYDMVDTPAVIRSLCTLGDRILAVCSDEQTVANIKVKILDGAFITENYDLAVHMLEQGIPGKDKAWHEMSLPKVKAHRALAQKKPREAVKYFREFMNAWISSKQEEEYDPTSGIAYSREWILGRNALRIAGILDSIPDKAEADKAREEAKAYFKVALVKAKGDAEAMKLLSEETKGLNLQ